MNIIHHIAKKELVESWRDGSLRLVGSFMYLFLIASLIIGWTGYKRLSEEKQEAKKKVREQWLNQGVKNPHGAGHFGTIAFKPVSSLYILEKGMSNYLGQWIYLETHTRNDAEKRPAKDATSLLRFGELTTGFLFQFLAPLAVILLCYSSFSKEKENNTLRLLLSQEVSNRSLMAGKCLGNIYKLLLLLLPMFLTVILFVFIKVGFSNYLLFFIAAILGSYFIFLLIFLFVSTGVSLVCSSSKRSMLILFAFWIVTCVFIPRLTSSVSEKIYPSPSSFDFTTAYENTQGNKNVYGYEGFNSFTNTYQKIEQEQMKKYHVTNTDSLPVNVFGLALESSEEEGQHIFDKSYGELSRIFKKQNNVHRYLTVFSPLTAVRFLSMGLSHSDIEEHIHFADAAEQYRRQVMKTLNMDIAYNSKKMNYNIKKRGGSESYTRGRDLWESIPDFTYRPLSFTSVIKNHSLDIVVLSVWFLLSLVFVFIISLKLKVIK